MQQEFNLDSRNYSFLAVRQVNCHSGRSLGIGLDECL